MLMHGGLGDDNVETEGIPEEQGASEAVTHSLKGIEAKEAPVAPRVNMLQPRRKKDARVGAREAPTTDQVHRPPITKSGQMASLSTQIRPLVVVEDVDTILDTVSASKLDLKEASLQKKISTPSSQGKKRSRPINEVHEPHPHGQERHHSEDSKDSKPMGALEKAVEKEVEVDPDNATECIYAKGLVHNVPFFFCDKKKCRRLAEKLVLKR